MVAIADDATTIGGTNSIMVCHDMVMMFGRPL